MNSNPGNCSIKSENLKMSHEKLVGVLCADDSDHLSDGEEFFPESDLEKLPWDNTRKKLTADELKMKRTYSYDPEPVKAWREITDYMAIKECNDNLWSTISNYVGKHLGYTNSLCLYRERHSEVVRLIERELCPKKCYYFPANCIFNHGHDFKNLLNRKLHKRFNPEFENLFKKDENKVAVLERAKHGPPNMIKLAEDIGYTTKLEYDKDGFLIVDMSVFDERFWNDERPSFVQEEKKVLDTVHALLVSSLVKQDNDVTLATEHYSQRVPGVNDPVLKVMGFGPDLKLKSFTQSDTACNLSRDENKAGRLSKVTHEECSNFKREDHWLFVHYEIGEDSPIPCENKDDLKLDGPASACDASIVYPCNLKHCWRCCLCKFCQLARQIKCKDHHTHITYNVRKCKIQESAQCQDHWIDHPENFNTAEDIQVERNILFHNKKVNKEGRNYRFRIIKYAGLKIVCKKCRNNTKEHLNEHLTPHMQCKHCLYELKTMKEVSFWRRVCKVCGKVFDDEVSTVQHEKRHEITVPECEMCGEKCSTNSNLHRHMLEQHTFSQEETLDKSPANEPFVCAYCSKTFRYQRNLNTHIDSFHTKANEHHCEICEQKFSTKSNFKRHLTQQHDITEFGDSIYPKEVKVFTCTVCATVFKRKQNLKAHQLTHIKTEKFTCEQCGKQYILKTGLVRHEKIHSGEREKFECESCNKTFLSRGSLGRHIDGIHRS